VLLDRVTLGDHVCWTVDDDAVRMTSIAAFVRAGLGAGHRVLYCGDDPEAVLAGLSHHGVGTGAATGSGLLSVATAEDVYLTGGRFDPESTLARWRTQIAACRAAGLPGIRVIGDMTWATRPVPGADRLFWYEAEVNNLFTDGYVAGVCAFDARRFDPRLLGRLGQAHPGAAATGAPYDPSCSLRVRRTHRPWGLRLTGEADVSAREALRALIAHLFDDAPEVTVDVAGLRFADSSACRLLVGAASGGRGRLRLTGCSAALRRLLAFHGAAAVPGLSVE